LYQMIEGASPRAELLQYRQALCLEGLGRWDQALAAYRYVVSHADKELVAKALLSQARILLRLGQAAEAKNILFPFLLPGEGAESELVRAGRSRLALALAAEALARRIGGPLEDNVVRPFLGPWKLQRALDGGKKPVPGNPKDAEANMPKLVIIEKGGVPP